MKVKKIINRIITTIQIVFNTFIALTSFCLSGMHLTETNAYIYTDTIQNIIIGIVMIIIYNILTEFVKKLIKNY